MSGDTAGRRALVVGPSFFGYERDIVRALERTGFKTAFLDERRSQAASYRAVHRVARRAGWSPRSQAHERFLRTPSAVGLDLVLVVKAEHTSRGFVASLRRLNPNARFVFYAFDPISKSAPWVAEEEALFDAKYSFDPVDVEVHASLDYLPLFFGPLFASTTRWEDRRYDVSFVGTLHSGRYEFVEPIVRQFDSTFAFYYSPARWDYALRRTSANYAGVPRAAVTFSPLAKAQVAEVCAQSRVVIDLPRPEQAGLTMRTFEALGAGSGLVTVNRRAYELLPAGLRSRVAVVSLDDPGRAAAAAREIMESASSPLPPEVGQFSIDHWCARIVGSSQSRV